MKCVRKLIWPVLHKDCYFNFITITFDLVFKVNLESFPNASIAIAFTLRQKSPFPEVTRYFSKKLIRAAIRTENYKIE